MATSVSIIISASAARAVAAFSAIRLGLRSLAAQAGVTASTIGKMAPYALMAGKVILAASAAGVLTGVLGNLLPIVQLVAPAVVAAGAAMAVFKLSLSGVGDALKAGMDGDIEKLNEALKKLSPSAKSTVLTLLDLRKEWKSTQQAVQEKFFAGARNDLISVSRAIQPIADKWLPKLASAFGMARHALQYVFTEAAKSGQLDTIFAGVTKFFEGLMNSVAPLARAFLDVAEVASGTFGEMGGGIAGAAQKFSDWIREMKNNGQLKEWLDKAKKAFGELKDILVNVGGILKGIFQASSDEGEDMLSQINKSTKSMSDWANSGDGQKTIDFISSILKLLGQVAPLFETWAAYMESMGVFWEALWDGIKSVFKGAVDWILGGYEMVFRAAGAAARAMGMDGLANKLEGAANAVGGFKDKVNAYLDGIRKTVDITVNYRARMIGNHLVSGSQQSGSYSSGIGGVATGGYRTGLRWVGEYGPELADFGAGGRTYNHNDSMKMASSGGGSGGGMAVVLEVAAGGRDWLSDAISDGLRSGRIKAKVDTSGRVKPA